MTDVAQPPEKKPRGVPTPGALARHAAQRRTTSSPVEKISTRLDLSGLADRIVTTPVEEQDTDKVTQPDKPKASKPAQSKPDTTAAKPAPAQHAPQQQAARRAIPLPSELFAQHPHPLPPKKTEPVLSDDDATTDVDSSELPVVTEDVNESAATETLEQHSDKATDTQEPAPSPSVQESADTPSSDAESDETSDASEDSPYAVVTLQTTGIHPSTARIVAIDVVVMNSAGRKVDTYHAVVNPKTDTGPFHVHGLTREQIAEGVTPAEMLEHIMPLLSGRTVIMHNAPRTWGFIVAEAYRARKSASLAMRGIPRQRPPLLLPEVDEIVDVLASARRQCIRIDDERVRGLARACGLHAPQARASQKRARMSEKRFTRQSSMLVWSIFLRLQQRGSLAVSMPHNMRADRFGVQRSLIRVDAHDGERRFLNPGIWQPGEPLVEGMEVVISPDIAADPDDLIAALLSANLSYSEKLTRTTSIVVTNRIGGLFGKTLHAHRKGIPFVSDEEFLQLTRTVAPGQRNL